VQQYFILKFHFVSFMLHVIYCEVAGASRPSGSAGALGSIATLAMLQIAMLAVTSGSADV
jgi:hypothetical protein